MGVTVERSHPSLSALRSLQIVMIGPFGLRPKGTMRVRALPLARELARRGHQVTLLMPPWHTPDEPSRTWEEDGLTLRYVPLGPRVSGLAQLCETRRLVRAALALQPDVIHCFKPKGHAGLAAWWLWQLRRLGRRRPALVVDTDDWEGPGGWNDRGDYSAGQRRFFAWQERWGMRHCDALTVASRVLQSLAWSQGLRPEKVHYLPNGVRDWPGGDRASARQAHGLGDDPTILLYTRFFEFDPVYPIEALLIVRRSLPKARLLLVGKGLFPEDDARFWGASREAGLENAVVDAGWVSMDQLPDLFAAADVAVYPFRDDLLNRCKCPVKLLDLVGAGVPLVGDDVGQIREAIRDGRNGLLVPSGSADAMAEAVVALLSSEERRAAMRRGAKAIAQAESWAARGGDLEALYQGLVRER